MNNPNAACRCCSSRMSDVVRLISTRITVMYLGRIVDVAPVGDIVATPRHRYTRALIASVPIR
ncbi:MAG: hypothetical protein Q8P60_05990 [Pseudorhodobacter sp.]|nr:hypothetical protein [Pseudorhodobacter sp.]